MTNSINDLTTVNDKNNIFDLTMLSTIKISNNCLIIIIGKPLIDFRLIYLEIILNVVNIMTDPFARCGFEFLVQVRRKHLIEFEADIL